MPITGGTGDYLNVWNDLSWLCWENWGRDNRYLWIALAHQIGIECNESHFSAQRSPLLRFSQISTQIKTVILQLPCNSFQMKRYRSLHAVLYICNWSNKLIWLVGQRIPMILWRSQPVYLKMVEQIKPWRNLSRLLFWQEASLLDHSSNLFKQWSASEPRENQYLPIEVSIRCDIKQAELWLHHHSYYLDFLFCFVITVPCPFPSGSVMWKA